VKKTGYGKRGTSHAIWGEMVDPLKLEGLYEKRHKRVRGVHTGGDVVGTLSLITPKIVAFRRLTFVGAH